MNTLATLQPWVGGALSWLLTYAIHSTILICAVWLLCRGVKPIARRVGPQAENRAWKFALLGGFLTASLQLALGVTPALGALEFRSGPELVERSVEPAKLGTLGIGASPQARFERELGARELLVLERHRGLASTEGQTLIFSGSPLPLAGITPPASAPEPSTVVEAEPAPLWPKFVLALILVGALLALLRLAACVRTLRQRLKDREEVLDDPVLESFLTLCRDAEIARKIRLSQSTRVASPLALWRREIVVPTRAVHELAPASMRSVLAHELAHLERRDPHWLALAAVIEALCFFQPLNRLARRGMQESAEILCDDWAIARTGDGVQFAKSLAELASWTRANRSVLVAGMISGERPLVRRVRRALDAEVRRFDDEDGPRPSRLLIGLGALALLVGLAPGAVDASPPKAEAKAAKVDRAEEREEQRAERRARKQAEKAQRKAEKARRRAEKARRKAQAIEREAAEAQRRAREAEREAARATRRERERAHAPGRERDDHGPQLIIRDGDDYLIIDGRGLRAKDGDGEIVIVDGERPRIRIHDGEHELDLDLGDALGLVGKIAGELSEPHTPSEHRLRGPRVDLEALEELGEALEEEFEERLEERLERLEVELEREFEADEAAVEAEVRRELEQAERELRRELDDAELDAEVRRELEKAERELRRELEQRRRRAPEAPRPPAAPSAPSAAPPAPPAPPAAPPSPV